MAMRILSCRINLLLDRAMSLLALIEVDRRSPTYVPNNLSACPIVT
jgi:hypothetical protein